MTTSLYLSSIEAGSGKAVVALGILDYVLRKTTRVRFFRPVIERPPEGRQDEDIALILGHFRLDQRYQDAYAWTQDEAAERLSTGRADEVIDRIITRFKQLEREADFVLCEGTDFSGQLSAVELDFNREMARNLGCPVLVVLSAHQRQPEEVLHAIQITVDEYEEKACCVAGVIVNKVAEEDIEPLQSGLQATIHSAAGGLTRSLVGVLPYDPRLSSPRIGEVAAQLGAEILAGDHRLNDLVSGYLVAAMQLQHAITWLRDGQLVITPGDRADIIVGMLQADRSTHYPRLAGLLLSTGFRPDPAIVRLMEGNNDNLPILVVKSDTFTTVTQAREVRATLAPTDEEKIGWIVQHFDRAVRLDGLEQQLAALGPRGMTPKMFTYYLLERARSQPRHIVLPEGDEPRILRAAAKLIANRAVRLTLVGRRNQIAEAIKKHGVGLDLDQVHLIDPEHSEWRGRYAETYYQLRRAKGMTLELAQDCMLDPSYFGTMMVHLAAAAGMVSGAVHTTQDTIRPALQIIKTAPGFSIVSSVFLMCLDDGVVVYGDCAVNPDPTAEQLAEIAISSADTAARFGIEPRVALLSYSSGDSGKGAEVEKVRQAARIARSRRPDLKLEGPIQYDAAVDPSVAAQKLPGSQVAGRATVFVFPDLNTGNNTYKAVQRETGALAIGPILQGLRKPVNDLSRGCTVEDVVNTVLITAIQAQVAEASR